MLDAPERPLIYRYTHVNRRKTLKDTALRVPPAQSTVTSDLPVRRNACQFKEASEPNSQSTGDAQLPAFHPARQRQKENRPVAKSRTISPLIWVQASFVHHKLAEPLNLRVEGDGESFPRALSPQE